jgi:hypothetical protein
MWFTALLILWLPCAILAGQIYGRRGRPAWAGFVAGLVLGPLALAFAALTSPDWNEVRRCPACRRLNNRAHTRCRECGTILN